MPYELKTKPNEKSVDEFLKTVENPKRQTDCYEVLKLMKNITGEEPVMWGDSIVGFGTYHYKYKSGHEGEWFIAGFAPRKQNLTLYIMSGFDHYDNLLEKLGKFKTGKSCLYINKLTDIDISILKDLIIESVNYMKKQYP